MNEPQARTTQPGYGFLREKIEIYFFIGTKEFKVLWRPYRQANGMIVYHVDFYKWQENNFSIGMEVTRYKPLSHDLQSYIDPTIENSKQLLQQFHPKELS